MVLRRAAGKFYVERVLCLTFGFLPLSRTRLRERFKEDEKNNKSFNTKDPGPLSSGAPPGSVLSNDFLCFFHCLVRGIDAKMKRRKTTKVVQHKSSRSPLPRHVAGNFYVERVCDDVLLPLFADSSARGLYIHDPKLICNKSAQRPEEIQNKSHGLACSPLCSISFANPETHRFNFNS